MLLSKNFSLDEMVLSDTAARLGIDNTPPASAVANLRRLATTTLQPLRDAIGSPVRVLSGYRSYELNATVGGAPNSAHMQGRAADLWHGVFTPRDMLELLVAKEIEFDKAIEEFGRWLHVQVAHEGQPNRRLIFRAFRRDGRTVYEPLGG